MPHLKTVFSKTQIEPRRIIQWPEYTKKTSFFETRLAFRQFWVQEPRCSENILAEMCYLYRRTRPSYFTPSFLLFPLSLLHAYSYPFCPITAGAHL